MTESTGQQVASPLDRRVLILAPDGRNAEVISATLQGNGFMGVLTESHLALSEALMAGTGALVITDDALQESDAQLVIEALKRQSVWSDLPIILLTWPDTAVQALDSLAGTGSLIHVLDRPTTTISLITAVASALKARSRQYEIRALLKETRDLNTNLEKRVEKRTGKLRIMAAKLEQAEENERARIAQILHDDLQQTLVAATMKLQLMRTAPEENVQAGLAETESILDKAIELTRTLSSELSPPFLRKEGLAAALRWLQKEMGDKHHLEVNLLLEKQAGLRYAELDGLLFQTVRELLFNIVKHAGTRSARLSLKQNNSRIIVRVEDDGRGFDTADLEKRYPDHGLFRCQKRIMLHGGELHVKSTPGSGTCVVFHLPLS